MQYLKVVLVSVFFVFCNTGFAAFDQKAGPIWNQQDAQSKCPNVCGKKSSTWTGQWRTTVQGKMSVCQCEHKSFPVKAGPIWNQQDAQIKCPNVCRNNKSSWTGQWTTTIPGEMSICDCVRR